MKILFMAGLITILALFTSCTKKEEAPEKGVSHSLAKHRTENISQIEYNLHLDIPGNINEKISGMQTITFHLNQIDERLVIDFRANADDVDDVQIDEKSVDYAVQNDHILIPPDFLKHGKNEIKIVFTAGDQSLNRNKEYLYTLFVPDRASTAFPCFDQPNLKAKYNLTLTIPDSWVALSNGALINKKKAQSKTEWSFVETKPISTYLFGFVAGKFDKVTREKAGRQISLYHREKDKKKVDANLERVFELQFNALEWLEEYTAIPYPFNKYDLILIPSFQYSGMEHPGAVYYRDSKIFLEESATIRDKLGRANLINHETAHMWFGDLVTMEWFNEVWLKEVFANFIADKITRPQFPDINHALNFLLNHYPSSYSVDRTKGANPIQQKLDNLLDAGTLYGAIIYHKAPIVMEKLEKQTGTALLQAGIREYLNNNLYGTATWNDLITILNKQTDADLAHWSNVWVNEAGMPHITAQYTDTKKITIQQADPEEKGRIWPQELQVHVGNHSEVTKQILLNTSEIKTEEWPVSKESTRYLLPNAGGKGYGYFELDQSSMDYFLRKVSTLQNELERAVIWINLWENVLHFNLSPEKFQESIISQLPEETNPQCAELITGYLETNFWKLLNDSARMRYAEKTEKMIWEELAQDKSQAMKSNLFNTYVTIASTEKAVDKLYNVWRKKMKIENLPLSTKDYTNLAFNLVLKRPERSHEIKEIQLERITDEERKERFQFIFKALHPEIEVRDQFFESIKKVSNREKEPWVATALSYLHHPLRAETSVQYIRESLALLPEIQQTGDIFFPKSWLDATLSGHSSREAKQVVETFLKEHPDFPENLKMKISQSSDMLYRAVKMNE